jgi:hypothetical protein
MRLDHPAGEGGDLPGAFADEVRESLPLPHQGTAHPEPQSAPPPAPVGCHRGADAPQRIRPLPGHAAVDLDELRRQRMGLPIAPGELRRQRLDRPVALGDLRRHRLDRPNPLSDLRR